MDICQRPINSIPYVFAKINSYSVNELEDSLECSEYIDFSNKRIPWKKMSSN